MENFFFNDYYYNAETNEILEHDNLTINNISSDIEVIDIQEIE